jgi:dTDP-4-amino-4,6-dideoxygalactose transaminase
VQTVNIRVRLYDTSMNYRRYRHEIDEGLRDVLERGNFVMGEPVRQFEHEFAAYCGVRYCVATTSGTQALHLALAALGIGPGDEVITAANTDVGTCLGIEHAGATVRLADITASTFNLDPTAVVAAVTARTRAIVPVHMYGLPCDMDAIRGVARRHDLLVVEDAALAAGATYHGRRAGSLGNVGIFSLAAGKVLGGLGAGGVIVTDREDVARMANSLRHYGRDGSAYRTDLGSGMPPSVTVRLGFNARLDTLQAAALRVRLRHLDEELARRRAVAGIYTRAFAGLSVITPEAPPGYEHAYRTYVIRVHDRDRVHERLLEDGIETGLHYVPPIHLHPHWQSTYRAGDFPVSEQVSADLLCLPCHPSVTDEEAGEIAQRIREML